MQHVAKQAVAGDVTPAIAVTVEAGAQFSHSDLAWNGVVAIERADSVAFADFANSARWPNNGSLLHAKFTAEGALMSKTILSVLMICSLFSVPVAAGAADSAKLAAVLDAQSAEVKARYQWRHPQETLEFFGITPGMTVVEALPGGGWYTKLIAPYLGEEGQLIGADYSMDMYPLFGFFSEERLEKQSRWVETFPSEAAEWSGEAGAPVAAFSFGQMPEDMKGTADAVLFIRALHNLARFESQGGFLTTALKNTFDVLKSGGTVGVVQHLAAEDMPDDWAGGQNGYLKNSFVIEVMEGAGFEYVAQSDVNLNPKDQPTDEDIVWRLPPSLVTSRENPELRAEMEAIGESSRMTLMFRKP